MTIFVELSKRLLNRAESIGGHGSRKDLICRNLNSTNTKPARPTRSDIQLCLSMVRARFGWRKRRDVMPSELTAAEGTLLADQVTHLELVPLFRHYSSRLALSQLGWAIKTEFEALSTVRCKPASVYTIQYVSFNSLNNTYAVNPYICATRERYT